MRFAHTATIATMICGAALAASAGAQSLKQREMIANDKKQVAEHLAAANKTCGSNVQINTDYSTFADVETSPDNPNQQSPWAFIVNVTDAMDSLCRSSPEAKEAVATKLKTVNVRHAAAESESYSNGVLTYAVPYQGTSYQKIMALLRDKL
ncbi:hypothetical protein [Terriglobus sp.]|uniref:hypothetical protein n=1 Tax=Terriglobus sp. TaxID=1889013 RepID=UPI003AFFA113